MNQITKRVKSLLYKFIVTVTTLSKYLWTCFPCVSFYRLKLHLDLFFVKPQHVRFLLVSVSDSPWDTSDWSEYIEKSTET